MTLREIPLWSWLGESVRGGRQRGWNRLFCEEGTWQKQLARKFPQPHSRWQLPDHAPNGGTLSVRRDAFPKMERGRENVHHILAPPRGLLGPISDPQGGCKTRGGGCCCPSNNQGARRRAQLRRDQLLRSLAAGKVLGDARTKPRKSASAERGTGQAHELQSPLSLGPT